MDEHLILRNRLKTVRKEKKLSQTELAELVGVSRNTVSSIETGQFNPTAKMELEELIVEIVIGLFLLFTSYQIGIKENITLLHGYHYTQLDPKDKKVFTKKIGIGTLLVSIGILVMPIINLISHSELGYYIGLILIVVGVFYIIFIIVKYNGKLISFKK